MEESHGSAVDQLQTPHCAQSESVLPAEPTQALESKSLESPDSLCGSGQQQQVTAVGSLDDCLDCHSLRLQGPLQLAPKPVLLFVGIASM